MRRFLPLAIFLSVALASLATAGYSYLAGEEAARIRFESYADDAVSRIEALGDQHLSLMRAALAFFAANRGNVSYVQFDDFVETLEISERFAGLRAVGYAALTKTERQGDVEAALQRDRGPGVHIWPPATDQEWRTPVVYLAPLDDRNRASLGFDMFSESTRRAGMVEAMRSGEARATGHIKLVQGSDGRSYSGFIVYLPVPAGPSPTDSADAPRPIQGFLYAGFRAGDFFNVALGFVPLLPISLEIHDDSAGPDSLLFQTEAAPSDKFDAGYGIEREVNFAGRVWTLRFKPSAAFTSPVSQAIPFMFGFFGIVLAAAIALLARYQERAYAAAAQLHSATEKSLFEKDLMLQEMKHRIKNSIARVLAIARQTASKAGSVDEFQTSFGARLQGMAASQERLTRSRWQKADLGELLRTEMEQVFGKNFGGDALNGPRINLDETTTQALGLTFHELATNALKYGEAGSGGKLTVTWRAETEGRKRKLWLTWKETNSKPVRAPEKTGFGTRLIDMNIVRELGGTIDRTYGDDSLIIEIVIPLRSGRD